MFHVGMVVVAAIAITIVGIAVKVLLAFSVAVAPPVLLSSAPPFSSCTFSFFSCHPCAIRE
jgi:hypothetical protein